MDACLESRRKPAKNSTAPIRAIAAKLLKDETRRLQELICIISHKALMRRGPPLRSGKARKIVRLRRRRGGHSTDP
jgi:hypothetical protein